MSRIPVDSADARELRELEAEREAQAARHECVDGWTGEDDAGRPVPCPHCRPHLLEVACRLCQASDAACRRQRARGRGACCENCNHRQAVRT